MATQVYKFKITYAGCEDKIWRIAAVSSNYTLDKLGFMVLATFDTNAYHLFDMKYKNTTYFLTEEDFEDLPCEENEEYELLECYKLGELNMKIGDTIKMTYDMGCEQVFNIQFIETSTMARGSGKAYPKILDGAGCGIIDDMFIDEFKEIIEKIDNEGHSGIPYSRYGYSKDSEWDYREYDLEDDNMDLKDVIEDIYYTYHEEEY